MTDKLSTGISGFDALTNGGLPRGRLVSLVGTAGTGKTIFALQTLAHRMRDHGEHTIFVSFEQPTEHVVADVSSFDWDFVRLAGEGLSMVDAGLKHDSVHNGPFTLEALTASLTAVVEQTGATTVVLDGIDALLSLLGPKRERTELARVVNWLRRTNVTGIITVKPGDLRNRSAARAEFLEYQTDCVIYLDTVTAANIVSRTLRMVKYRGSQSDGELVPMVLNSSGITLICSAPLHEAFATGPMIETTRYSSGLPELDALLQGGYRRGSTTMISGAPGTAKSTLAAAFALSCADAGMPSLYVSFDETPEQIASHVASVGFDVQSAIEKGTLGILSLHSAGLPPEVHVERLLTAIDEQETQAVVIDPISAIMRNDHPYAARVVEHLLVGLRNRSVTMLCTSLLEGTSTGISESTQSHVSTLADTWIHLSYVAAGGERNRTLTIVKSRGTAHSNQVRELVLSDSGASLKAVYTADGDVLLGTARLQKEASERREGVVAEHLQKVREARAEKELDALASRLSDTQRDMARKEEELRELRAEREETLESEGADLRERVEARSNGSRTDGEWTQDQE